MLAPVRSFLNLFLQSACPLCQRATPTEFCANCTRQLQQNKLPNPAQFWQEQPAVFAWGWYGGNVRQAIRQLKYDHQPQIARPLGQWLAQSWLDASLDRSPMIVVPIPMHGEKQKQRGYNQAALIAQSFCHFTGHSMQVNGLERVRSTEAQFNLSAAQREQNLFQAFKIGKSFQKKKPQHPVLLLDDIYTTGATIRATAQVLRQQGIRVRGVAILAKARPWKDEANS